MSVNIITVCTHEHRNGNNETPLAVGGGGDNRPGDTNPSDATGTGHACIW